MVLARLDPPVIHPKIRTKFQGSFYYIPPVADISENNIFCPEIFFMPFCLFEKTVRQNLIIPAICQMQLLFFNQIVGFQVGKLQPAVLQKRAISTVLPQFPCLVGIEGYDAVIAVYGIYQFLPPNNILWHFLFILPILFFWHGMAVP